MKPSSIQIEDTMIVLFALYVSCETKQRFNLLMDFSFEELIRTDKLNKLLEALKLRELKWNLKNGLE